MTTDFVKFETTLDNINTTVLVSKKLIQFIRAVPPGPGHKTGIWFLGQDATDDPSVIVNQSYDQVANLITEGAPSV